MSGIYTKLHWQESMNDVTIDCSLDIAIHPADSNVILLTVPGVDGSVDGFENKYVTIAESIQKQHGAAVVRIANPFITSHHWESNVRQALAYINEHASEICGYENFEIRIIAHSAGAAILGQIAWEYPEISRILLVNPAIALNTEGFTHGLSQFSGNATILVGTDDPSYGTVTSIVHSGILDDTQLVEITGADHHFSEPHFQVFLESPTKYLFEI